MCYGNEMFYLILHMTVKFYKKIIFKKFKLYWLILILKFIDDLFEYIPLNFNLKAWIDLNRVTTTKLISNFDVISNQIVWITSMIIS